MLILNYIQANRVLSLPLPKLALYARKVGFVKSDGRGKQETQRSELKALYLLLVKSIAKSKNFVSCLLTKITPILKVNMSNL